MVAEGGKVTANHLRVAAVVLALLALLALCLSLAAFSLAVLPFLAPAWGAP